ncbi:MAG: hypothetical protein CL607_15065 [Anaerolineaceae bacterium]|nr:hypothetical protein [Anaerolineaceae bacterium]
MIALTGKDETMLMGTGPIPAAHCVRLNDLVHEAYRKSDYELVARINARFNEIGMQTFYDKAKDDVYLVVTPADVIPPDAG